MPACASSMQLDEAMARCAEIVFSVAGVRMTASLGGAAKASFPTKSAAELAALNTPQHFSVEWEAAVFHGVHPVLGKITARLIVYSLAQHPSFVRSVSIDQPSATPGFFPALNRNNLPFQIEIPRFGLVYRSDQAVINSSMIDRIPPIGSIYLLENRPIYSTVSTLSTSFLSVVSPSIKLESCRVKLMELQNLKVDLELKAQDQDSVTFSMTVKNDSTEDAVQVTWLVWPEPEEAADKASGSLELQRAPVTANLTLPRNIFYLPRWLAVAIAAPFETDGAQAAMFPSL